MHRCALHTTFSRQGSNRSSQSFRKPCRSQFATIHFRGRNAGDTSSLLWDSNPWPPAYWAGALPAKLKRQWESLNQVVFVCPYVQRVRCMGGGCDHIAAAHTHTHTHTIAWGCVISHVHTHSFTGSCRAGRATQHCLQVTTTMQHRQRGDSNPCGQSPMDF